MPNSVADCTIQTTKGDLAFSESGVHFHLINPQRFSCKKVQVDKCLPITGVKCDWLVLYNQDSILIELKGGDVLHAVDQLDHTINWLKKHLTDFPSRTKKCYIVTSNRCPKTSAQTLNIKAKFRKKHGANINIDFLRSGTKVNIS